jgi:hypothetical protein
MFLLQRFVAEPANFAHCKRISVKCAQDNAPAFFSQVTSNVKATHKPLFPQFLCPECPWECIFAKSARRSGFFQPAQQVTR